MNEIQENSQEGYSYLVQRIEALEKKVAALEFGRPVYVQNSPLVEPEPLYSGESSREEGTSGKIESRLGEYGLAWLGNIVMFFAIAFLMQYFNNINRPLIAVITGIGSVAAAFGLSVLVKKSFSYLSYTFNLFGFITLFYIGVRLHYFCEKPIIINEVYATLVLLAITASQFYYSLKRNSQVLSGLSFGMAMLTAYFNPYPFIYFSIFTLVNAITLFSFLRFNWWKPLIIILSIGFFINLVWLFKDIGAGTVGHESNYLMAFIFFSINTILYSLVVLRKPSEDYPENVILAIVLLAGLSYTVLLTTLVFMHFSSGFTYLFLSVSVFCVAYSILLKFYSPWKYAAALYALFGFVSISVTIFGLYHIPDSFLLLTYQSVLVLILALWYRSQIIILMNTVLMVMLMFTYYKLSGNLHSVNFSLPIVAFISARIINLQKERLQIKTDFIRNTYLIILFFSLLYATYKGLPSQYVTISWLAAGGLFFLISILLKNNKYRWMAMGNLLVSGFHLFLVDMAHVELIYRILAFLVFAVVSIVISAYYVKKLNKKS